MDNPALINKYIDKLNEEIIEVTKRRIVADSHNAFLQEQVDQTKSAIDDLQKEHDEYFLVTQTELQDLRTQLENTKALLEESRVLAEDRRVQNAALAERISDLEGQNAGHRESIAIQRKQLHDLNMKIMNMEAAPSLKKKKVSASG